MEAPWIVPIALAAMLTFGGTSLAAEPRSVTDSYVVGVGTVGVCMPEPAPSPNVACFQVQEGEATVDLKIQDRVNHGVCGHFEIYGKTGKILDEANFKGSKDGIVLPSDAYEVGVFPGAHDMSAEGTHADDLFTCPEGKATWGNVTATFHTTSA